MTWAKTVLVLVLAIFSAGRMSTSAFSQDKLSGPLAASEYHSKCIFLFKDSVSMYRLSQIGLYKYCDGMKPTAAVTVELHGVVTSQREAKWRFCASPKFPQSSVCPDGQGGVNAMAIDYKDTRPGSEIEIAVAATTTASRDGFAFAWIADVGCAAALPSSACDVVLLPGATLTFSADGGP